MGLTLWARKSIETDRYAQDGNVELRNHLPAPYATYLIILSSGLLTIESVFSFPPVPPKP